MKTLVIYYSYTGKTCTIALEKAKEVQGDCIRLYDAKKKSKLNVYTAGIYSAKSRKMAQLQTFVVDFTLYDKIIIAMPLWAGFPAPPFNNILPLLPNGKEVEVIITSGSGNSSKSEPFTKDVIQKQGCTLCAYINIQTKYLQVLIN